MRGLGTIINVACIIVGGLIGYFAGNKLKEHIRETLLTMTGIGVVVMGLGGALAKMFSVAADGRIATGGTIMMILSLALGAIIGELLQLEEKIVGFGEWLKVKSHNTGDSSFVGAFVAASCTVSIGAMAIIGSIQDGIGGDYSILATKGIIDFFIICVMTAALGKGCIFSAIPVGIFQGICTLLAFFVGNFLPQASLDNLSLVGSVLIMCIGLNSVRTKQIRVANVLPALIIAIAWGFFVK